jgi:hypothetical protein
MSVFLATLANALAALSDPAPAEAAPAQSVAPLVVTALRPVHGDLQQGTLNYRPEFFTQVRPSTALDMVNWLPGFTFEDTRDMRGLDGSTGNVLIDGKPPTSKTDTLTSVLRRIPADQVERVDIIVGGAPGIDMHGRSVIANVVLKVRTTALRVVALSSYVDTHGRASPDLLMTTSEKHDGKLLEGSLDIGRNNVIYPSFGYGPWVRRDGSGALLFSADERFLLDGPSVVGSGAYEFSLAGGRLKLNGLGRFFGQFLNEDDPLTSGPGQYGFHEKNDYTQGELGLHYERPFGRVTLETQALERYTGHAVDDDVQRPPEPSTDTQDGHEQESVVRAVLRFKTDDKLTLEGFAEDAFNTVVTRTRATQDGAPEVVPVGDVQVDEQRIETGASLAWKPDARFSLDAALKVEASQLSATGDEVLKHDFAYAKPRLALTWSPDKDTQYRLRGEQEVNQIPFGAFVTYNEYNSGQLRNGNPDILPSRAWVAEGVADRHFWGSGDLTLTARFKALKNVLDVVPAVTAAGSYEMLSNIGDGRETDLIANLTLPMKRIGLEGVTVKAAFTWSRARVADPVSGLQRPLSNTPETMAELHLAQDLSRWKLNWGVDAFYRGATTLYRPFGNEAIEAWPHVNLFVEYRIKPTLNLRVEVQNLPGERLRQTVSVFSGLRDQSPLLYVDDKRLSVGPLLFVRLRRTFE